MKLSEAVAMTFHAMGQDLPDMALAMICSDLEGYPMDGVATALSRCRKELRKVTLADILERIPGGHPGAEEAWSIVAKALTDEQVTIVWTQQIAEAFGRALDLNDDPVAARMAFKETYTRLVAEAREAGTRVTWTATLGWDAAGRDGPLQDAVCKGRLTQAHVAGLLPNLQPPPEEVSAIEGKLQ
jgi:hypothetical protein